MKNKNLIESSREILTEATAYKAMNRSAYARADGLVTEKARKDFKAAFAIWAEDLMQDGFDPEDAISFGVSLMEQVLK